MDSENDAPTPDTPGAGARPGATRGQVIALALAVVFLAGAIGFRIGDRSASPSAVDVGFAQDMIAHHDQAVSMALHYLDTGSPIDGGRGFAKDVIVTQRYEIGVMDTWLRGWNRSRAPTERTDAMAWMGMASAPDAMPGMATPAQLQQLADSSGRAADALFFRLMIAHHQGGIHMADYAARHAKDPRVKRLARGIELAQRREIGEMRQAQQRLGLPA
jgi:uncharacterized protein (DUF305 family)